jgi:hypothetical protein
MLAITGLGSPLDIVKGARANAALDQYLWDEAHQVHQRPAPTGYANSTQVLADLVTVDPKAALVDTLIAVLTSNPLLKWNFANLVIRDDLGPSQLANALRWHGAADPHRAINGLFQVLRASKEDPHHRRLPDDFYTVALQAIVDLLTLNPPTGPKLSPDERRSFYAQLQMLGVPAKVSAGWPQSAVTWFASQMPAVDARMEALKSGVAATATLPWQPTPAYPGDLDQTYEGTVKPYNEPSSPGNVPQENSTYSSGRQLPLDEKPTWFWPVVAGGGAVVILSVIAMVASSGSSSQPRVIYAQPPMYGIRSKRRRK